MLAPVQGGIGLHAWVVFEQDGKTSLFESTALSIHGMLRSLDDVRAFYIPHFSVGHDLVMRMYCGRVTPEYELRKPAPTVAAIELKMAG